MMSRHTRRNAILAAVALFLALGLCSAPTAGALELRLSILETPIVAGTSSPPGDPGLAEISIAQGEPLYVRIELHNNSDQPVNLYPSVNPSFGLVHFYLANPEGYFDRFTTQRWEVYDVYIPIRAFQPDERIVYETHLFGKYPMPNDPGELEYIFSRPGNWQLYARYYCPDPPLDLESNRVMVRVGDPIPNWNELVAEGIIDRVEGRTLSGDDPAAQLTRLTALAEQAPAQPYAPWFTPAAELQKAAALDPAMQIGIENALAALVSAWNSGDIAAAAEYMSDDFQFNGTMSRDAFQGLMREGFDQLREGGNTPRITFEESAMTPRGADIEVTFRLLMGNDSAGTIGEQRVRVMFTRQDDAWLIDRWKRLEP